MIALMNSVTAFAPATVSNVACGFDVLGFALEAPGDEVTARFRESPSTEVTIDEAGVKGYEMTYWFAAYVPAKTPQPVIRRLNELLVKAIGTESAKAFFAKNGLVRFTTSPDELAKFQAAETQKWGRIIKSAGIQPE